MRLPLYSMKWGVMKEIREIIRAFDQLQKAGKKAALATVVHVEGSSYRRPGARMLIAEDGQLTGAISGGCLEGDAMRKALYAISEQRPVLVTYDTSDEDDTTLGVGLGCNGIIQVLIEPVVPAEQYHPVALLQLANKQRQEGVIATFFLLKNRRHPQPGTRLFLNQNGDTFGSCPIPALETRWRQDANQALQSRQSCWVDYATEEDGVVTVFYEYVPPAVVLVVIGAGNDVIPLINMAGVLGWEAIVADGRANYAKPERFGASCQVLLAKPEQVLEHVSIDDRTVFALMTHNYNYDKAMLHVLCTRNARYIAMLGPRKKLKLMLEEFESEGRPLTNEQLSAVFSPAGLDIGAETSEEIALSILSEIHGVLNGRPGNSLRLKTTPIHV